MIASRRASSRRDQPAISAKVRPQPMQMPAAPSTAQTLTQGVETGASLMPAELSHWKQARNRPERQEYRFSIKTH